MRCMTHGDVGLMALLFLLGSSTVAIAEDITLTTYYPAPRGVYEEIRTTNNTYLASLVGSVGIGTANVPGGGKFAVAGTGQNPVGGVCPSGTDWYDDNGNGTLDNGECKPTGLYVTASGNVGIGTTSPGEKLEVANGDIKVADYSDSTQTRSLQMSSQGVVLDSLVKTNSGAFTSKIQMLQNGLFFPVPRVEFTLDVPAATPSHQQTIVSATDISTTGLANADAGFTCKVANTIQVITDVEVHNSCVAEQGGHNCPAGMTRRSTSGGLRGDCGMVTCVSTTTICQSTGL